MDANPWQAQHAERETVFQDGDSGLAAALVANEYQGAPNAVTCECGGTAHYKATIGCMKCTRCGELYFSDGEKV